MNRFTAAILSDPKIIACMSLVPENCVSQSLKTEEYPTVDQIAERGILPKIADGIHNKNIPEGVLENNDLSHRISLAMNIWIDFNETCNFVFKLISRSCRNGTIIQYHHMTVSSLYEVMLFHWYILKYIKRLTRLIAVRVTDVIISYIFHKPVVTQTIIRDILSQIVVFEVRDITYLFVMLDC